jgi:hypothetical protein
MIIANFLTGGIQSPDVEHRSENAIKGAVNAAIPGMAIKGIKGASNLKMPAAFNKIDYEKPIEQIRSKYDLRDALSSKEFTDIKNEAYGRGVNIIPNIDKTIEAIEKGKYLPNTEAFKKLINKAKTGDYEAVRDLQTDLGHFGVSNRSSHIQAEKYKGIEMLDLREKINDAIQKHFKDQGHNDLADRLQNARNEYNDIIKTYHNTSGKTATTSTRAISKMVDKSKRLTPRNPETVFTEKSKPLDEFIKKHPEIAEVLKKSKFKIPAAVAGTMTGLDILHYLLK